MEKKVGLNSVRRRVLQVVTHCPVEQDLHSSGRSRRLNDRVEDEQSTLKPYPFCFVSKKSDENTLGVP